MSYHIMQEYRDAVSSRLYIPEPYKVENCKGAKTAFLHYDRF